VPFNIRRYLLRAGRVGVTLAISSCHRQIKYLLIYTLEQYDLFIYFIGATWAYNATRKLAGFGRRGPKGAPWGSVFEWSTIRELTVLQSTAPFVFANQHKQAGNFLV
jgi:hypothetical protein